MQRGLETFETGNVAARYVRVVGHGDGSGGTEFSLTEARINTISATASSAVVGSTADAAVDNDSATTWSSSGNGEWLQLDLGEKKIIQSVGIQFPSTGLTPYLFDIHVSPDGLIWLPVLTGEQSTIATAGLQQFVLQQLQSNGDPAMRYVRFIGHGRQGNQTENDVIEIRVHAATPLAPADSAWTTAYFGYDGQGSVRFLTNASGEITDTYDYDAFGNLISRTGVTSNNYLYMGEQFDPDLGLYYLRARYYNPQTGRFWTMDPYDGDMSNPDTLNKYTYARANPTSYADPTGNWAFQLHTLMIDTHMWFDARARMRDGFTDGPMDIANVYLPGAGVVVTACEYLATPKATHAWIGNSGADGETVGALLNDANQGNYIRDPELGGKLYLPHQNFFALRLTQEVNSKIERDVELAQLAVTSMRWQLNTNGLLTQQPRDPRYDELNFWLETSYHTGFFKALQLGGDPVTGSMDISIYPAHTGLGPGVQEAFAPTAVAMRQLRPRIAENPGGQFHSAVDYYHYIQTAGLPPEQWTEFLASGGWVLQGMAGAVLGVGPAIWNAPRAMAQAAYSAATDPLGSFKRFSEGLGESTWYAIEEFGKGDALLGVWHANNVVQGVMTAVGGAGAAARVISAGANLASRAAMMGARAAGRATMKALEAMPTGNFMSKSTRGVARVPGAELLEKLVAKARESTGKGGETAFTKAGRDIHKLYNPGPNYDLRVRLPSGKKPDAVDYDARLVRELKPNNARAIRRGERQVEKYRQELEETFGGDWNSIVDTYNR